MNLPFVAQKSVRTHIYILIWTFFILIFSQPLLAQDSALNQMTLQNEHIRLTVQVRQGHIKSEKITALQDQNAFFNGVLPVLQSDGDFALNVMWTDWQAPGKKNNAENPALLTKNDFRMVHSKNTIQNGIKELVIEFKGKNIPLIATLTYRLAPGDFFIKKQLSVRDTTYGFHFLRRIYPLSSAMQGNFTVIKTGGFGQPVALRDKQGGYFFGLEYPAAQNVAEQSGNGKKIRCSVEIGKKIEAKPIESGWTVMALTPPGLEKLWFSKYLECIRIKPLRPYTLYNSWYDLRSAEYPKVPETNVMNEKNVLHIIDLIKTNFVDKNNIHLDAFVLDDGWDVYRSNWQLRTVQFPNGFKPIVQKLKTIGTDLGVWFGPTGGYSFRNKRIDWMGKHGYEVVGKDVGNNNRMLCLAGKQYSRLLKKRTTDFVNKDGVRFFKWDGIQFSCSEPDHGHPVGIYSRRAVLDTLIALTRAVRAKHPDVYLNITSGTWLSPWWVQYANQIWMSGGDYGYSDVPSVSRRDAAMTYRDIVLYQDFKVNDFWMPIANLMTHGIIKGNLQTLGAKEPIDKFTNNALLYFARGVSMWELYISPDILSADEWSAISKSLHWAKENFEILKHTEMAGGNPGAKEAYAYVHCNGNKGIIAARNPFIEKKELKLTLAEKYNLNPQARNLVLERIYPTRWIDPQLHRAGDRLTLHLEGFETAVYQLYPLNEASEPLLAGAVFNARVQGNKETIQIVRHSEEVRLLNPETVQTAVLNGKPVTPRNLNFKPTSGIKNISGVTFRKVNDSGLLAGFTISKTDKDARFLLLLEQTSEPAENAFPQVEMVRSGQKLDVQAENQDGRWAWYSVPIPVGKTELQIDLKAQKKSWRGKASGWVISRQLPAGETLVLTTGTKMVARALPPKPWPNGGLSRTEKLGSMEVIVR